jgi:pimeloyl-ACP methyl ester carboxylesterase
LSDPAPPPRTAGDAANDLYALLDGSGISGPYVVVGASFGGYIARLFAAGFPREVAGLVLVDASHEDQAERLAEVLDPAQLETLLLDAPNNIEGMDLPRTWAEMHHADPIPEVPLVVLSAGREKPVPPGFPKQEFNQIWRELQDDLATLAPAAIHRWVDTNHDIALDRPQEVVDAVRWVLEQIGAASPCDRSSTS